MKRLCILGLLLLLLCVPARAAGQPPVVDGAGLLTQGEFDDLTARAEAVTDEYGVNVVILTVNSIGGKSARDYAADWYDGSGYGGDGGILLMLSMEYRDWYMLTTGEGIDAFTDYGLDKIEDDVIPYFSDGAYYDGFARFVRDAEIVLKEASHGTPYDVGNRLQLKTPAERLGSAAPYLAIAAAVLALVTLLVLIARMNTARPQRGAGKYVREGSFALERAADIFLYHTQTRVKVEKKSGSGGGSSTFTSSSGTSHGGSGGKF